MKRKLSLNTIKTIQLEILDDVHRFCCSNGIRYSLCGGTMLGAVRHQGYIPWDDDIDLMMPREDYERFIQSYHSEKNSLMDMRDSSDSVEICVKVCRNNTMMTDLQLGRSLWGVNIDIFPIDGAPAVFPSYCQDIKHIRKKIAQICPFYKVVSTQRWKWFLKYCLKRVVYFYPGTVTGLKKSLHQKAAQTKMESTGLGGVILGSYGQNEVVPAQTFQNYKEYLFEGKSYHGISDYDTYLSAIYGDYMTLPQKEAQVSHHLYDSFIIE